MSVNEESDTDHGFINNSLSLKSRQKYMTAYEYFMRWQKKRNEVNLNEGVFLTYFTELAQAQKPSSLWAQYSMLKATMQAKHGVNIKDYPKLLSFLKKMTGGFKSETTEVLTEDNILKFINEAPDEIYLATKVALIVGVGGACKIYELTDLTVNAIETHGNLMLVRINSHKNKKARTFIVKDEFVPVVKKYQDLRPRKMPTTRFFINYRAGQCTRQVIGRNKLAALPKQIASYLKLPNPERYTGYCYKRSSYGYSTGLMVLDVCMNTRQLAENSRNEMAVDTSVDREREYQSDIKAVDISDEVDIKVEEIDAFEEENLAKKLFAMDSVNDLPTTSQVPSGRKSSPDICDDTSEDSVHVKSKQVDRMINRSFLGENKSQSVNVPQKTNINVGGNNITLSFNDCANITINIIEH